MIAFWVFDVLKYHFVFFSIMEIASFRFYFGSEIVLRIIQFRAFFAQK